MWQNILVFAIIALAGGLTLWKFYEKFTGKSSCCGGGGSCKGACPSGGLKDASGKTVSGPELKPLAGCGSCCPR